MAAIKYALLAFGLVTAIGIAIAVIVVGTGDSGTNVLDLEVGDCLDLALDPGAADVGQVDTRSCSDAHEAEVVATGSLVDDSTAERPNDADAFAAADARCLGALADRPDVLDGFGILPVVADQRSWDRYDGKYVCLAIPYGGGTTTGSALAAG